MSMVEHVTLHHVYKLMSQTRFTMSYHLKTRTKQSQPHFLSDSKHTTYIIVFIQTCDSSTCNELDADMCTMTGFILNPLTIKYI